MKLAELASLIRSKNAGPFVLTFDIMFPDDESYLRVKNSGMLTIARFAELFRCPEMHVLFFECANARAFKFSIPRPSSRAISATGTCMAASNSSP